MTYAPTDEQQHAIDAFQTGDNLKIYAGAGTGKTSTLRFIADAGRGKRGLYAAFNKAIAADAKRRFAGTGVQTSTIHSLAYATHGAPHRDRLNQRFLFPAQQKAVLGIDTRFPIGGTYLSWQTILRLTKEALAQFCRSMDDEPAPHHVTVPATVLGRPEELAALRSYVADKVRVWWADWMSVDGALAWTHDTYLKAWALTHPQLPYDYVMLDEAQDLEPLTRGIMLEQNAQIIAVGDPNQAIYTWRGATNALDAFGGERAMLTQSFRFGDAIAEEANFWLALLESDMRLSGLPGKDSSVWASKRRPEAILTRTNGGAMQEIIDSQQRGIRVGVAGDRKAKELIDLANAALDLQRTGKTKHRDLDVFTSWTDVMNYVEDGDAEGDLAALVKVVDKYGAPAVVKAMESVVPASAADQVVSTVHVAKGLEWIHVRISEDFQEPKTDKATGEQLPLAAEEARLAYVAVTRAERHLDPTGLDWAKHMTGGVAVETSEPVLA